MPHMPRRSRFHIARRLHRPPFSAVPLLFPALAHPTVYLHMLVYNAVVAVVFQDIRGLRRAVPLGCAGARCIEQPCGKLVDIAYAERAAEIAEHRCIFGNALTRQLAPPDIASSSVSANPSVWLGST